MSAPESPVEPFKRAVTAAVRAIADEPELTVSFGTDGAGGQGGRSRLPMPSRNLPEEEVAQVRGAGDSLALWLRHHDDGLHSKFQPQGAIPRAVFEAAEQARVESIGANKMQGVSQNLDACLEERCRSRGYENVIDPSDAVLPEVIGLLVREKLTGKAPPEEARQMVESLRPWVEEKGGEELAEFSECVRDQARFARLTRRLIADLNLGEDDYDESDEFQDNPDEKRRTAARRRCRWRRRGCRGRQRRERRSAARGWHGRRGRRLGRCLGR